MLKPKNLSWKEFNRLKKARRNQRKLLESLRKQFGPVVDNSIVQITNETFYLDTEGLHEMDREYRDRLEREP